MNRNKWVAVASGVVVAGVLLFGGNLAQIFNAVEETVPQTSMAIQEIPNNNQQVNVNVPTTGVTFEDVTVGTGAEAKSGSTVTVHYTGTLLNGAKFDSSVDRGEPFTFQIGAGMVIRGWEEGFTGMKVGGKRRLAIAPDYGYGAQQVGPIPANSVLLFEVELLDVK